MDFQRTKARLQPRGSHCTHAISAPSRLAPPLVHPRYITCLLKSFNRVDIYSSTQGWWRGTVVERRSLAGELSVSCARPAADG